MHNDKKMTAAELEAGCRTYVSLKTQEMNRAKMLLSGKYSRVEESENGSLRIYDAKSAEEIVTYLYENDILISEIRSDKIGREEYYIDLFPKDR